MSQNEHPAESTVDGPQAAITADVVATTLSREDVFSWYDDALRDLGWTLDEGDLMNIRTTTEEAVRAWRKDDVAARVAILVKGDPRNPPADDHELLFELAFAATNPRSVAPSGSQAGWDWIAEERAARRPGW